MFDILVFLGYSLGLFSLGVWFADSIRGKP